MVVCNARRNNNNNKKKQDQEGEFGVMMMTYLKHIKFDNAKCSEVRVAA